MSEYMIDGALLTNIAEGVRSVDGSSSTLTPAQMQARLTAVKSSIDAALSALADKEVEVPSGSTVHGLANLISAVKTGSEIYTGTFTASTSDSSFSLGVSLPQFTNYCFMITNLGTGNRYGGVQQVINNSYTSRCYVGNNTYTNQWRINFAAGTITHNYFNTTSNTYRWVYFELEGTA